MHKRTFLRSTLAKDPFALGDFDPAKVLTLQRAFPTLFYGDEKPYANDEEEELKSAQNRVVAKSVTFRKTARATTHPRPSVQSIKPSKNEEALGKSFKESVRKEITVPIKSKKTPPESKYNYYQNENTSSWRSTTLRRSNLHSPGEFFKTKSKARIFQPHQNCKKMHKNKLSNANFMNMTTAVAVLSSSTDFVSNYDLESSFATISNTDLSSCSELSVYSDSESVSKSSGLSDSSCSDLNALSKKTSKSHSHDSENGGIRDIEPALHMIQKLAEKYQNMGLVKKSSNCDLLHTTQPLSYTAYNPRTNKSINVTTSISSKLSSARTLEKTPPVNSPSSYVSSNTKAEKDEVLDLKTHSGIEEYPLLSFAAHSHKDLNGQYTDSLEKSLGSVTYASRFSLDSNSNKGSISRQLSTKKKNSVIPNENNLFQKERLDATIKSVGDLKISHHTESEKSLNFSDSLEVSNYSRSHKSHKIGVHSVESKNIRMIRNSSKDDFLDNLVETRGLKTALQNNPRPRNQPMIDTVSLQSFYFADEHDFDDTQEQYSSDFVFSEDGNGSVCNSSTPSRIGDVMRSPSGYGHESASYSNRSSWHSHYTHTQVMDLPIGTTAAPSTGKQKPCVRMDVKSQKTSTKEEAKADKPDNFLKSKSVDLDSSDLTSINMISEGELLLSFSERSPGEVHVYDEDEHLASPGLIASTFSFSEKNSV